MKEGNFLSFLRTDKTQSTNKTEQVNLNNQNIQNSDEVLFDETPKIKNDNFICVEKYGIPSSDETPTIIYKPIDLEYVALKYGIPDFAPVNPEIPEEPPVKPDTPETLEEPVIKPFEPIITKYGFPELEEPDQPPVEPEVPVEPETPETPDEPKPSEWESATLPKKLNMVRSMMNKFKALQKDDEDKK